MKRIFSTVIAAALAIFSFCSCEEQIETPDSLSGTKWTAQLGRSGDGREGTYTLEFTSETNYVQTIKETTPGMEKDKTVKGTYTYNKPNIVLSSEDGVKNSGTFEDGCLMFESGMLIYSKK